MKARPSTPTRTPRPDARCWRSRDGLAHQIFDDTGFKLFREGAYVGAKGFEANTIAELAGKIGLVPEVLKHTVEEFNAACRDDLSFDPGNMDGKCTVGHHAQEVELGGQDREAAVPGLSDRVRDHLHVRGAQDQHAG